MRQAFREACAEFAQLKKETVCVFSEDLCGPLPGLNSVSDYGQAATIAKDFTRVAKEHFGQHLEVIFCYTTRDPMSWLSSLYRHHVKDGPMRMSFDEFEEIYRPASDLEKVAEFITKKLSPDKVCVQRLEDVMQYSHGPANKLLEVLSVPDEVIAKLEPVGLRHKGLNPDVTSAYLDLNRRIFDLDQLKKMKRELTF